MKNLEEQLSENLTIFRHETQSSNSSVRVNSDPIPIDLLIDILSRVPSKSIARFRCVSKFWGSILQSPDFTELFRTRCPGFLFTFGVNDDNDEVNDDNDVNDEMLYFYSPQHPNPGDNSYVVATRYGTSFPKYVPSEFQKLMRCGLVLRHGFWKRKVRVICNPATGEFITLPKLLLKDKTCLTKAKPKIARMGLGYDPINKQLKVLCMTESNTHQVLTLEKGKRFWRSIESEFDFMRSSEFPGEICINGVLYFGAYLGGSDSPGIVCFDVRSEKLSLINMDKGKVDVGPFIWGSTILVNYKGRFGIHKKKRDPIFGREGKGFDLWVLEDAGNQKWSKHEHEYPPTWKNICSEYMLRFIGMTSRGEMVFAQGWLSNPFFVFYYNFERKTFTRVNIRGFEEFIREKTRTYSFRHRGNTRTDSSRHQICTRTETYYEDIRIETFMDYGENMKLFK